MPSYSHPIASKLPRVGTTIFTVMSRLASEHNAINLSQGFPDFDCAAYDPEHEITVVPGATYGIFTAIATLVRPGDEVLLFEPAYDSYAPAVEVAGFLPRTARPPGVALLFRQVRGDARARGRDPVSIMTAVAKSPGGRQTCVPLSQLVYRTFHREHRT